VCARAGLLVLVMAWTSRGLIVDYCLFRAALVQSHQVQSKSLNLLRCPKSRDLLGHEWDKDIWPVEIASPITNPFSPQPIFCDDAR
jgi:hypothetical protein